jgi:DNA-binding transcriptional ArsR family regulator
MRVLLVISPPGFLVASAWRHRPPIACDTRRRILELLAEGAVCAVVQREFGITQPGVSAHLRVVREAGFATARAEGARRLYSVNPTGLHDVDVWLNRFRSFWTPHLDALQTELARGRREGERRARQEAQKRSSSNS